MDVELAVHACQVELDRLRAEEERRGHVAVRLALCDVKCDLKLLRGQLLGRRGIASGDRLAARSQLAACLLRPGGRAEPVEEFNRATQMLTRLDAALRASEPLAVEELRPCSLEGGTRSLIMQLECGAEVLVQVVVCPEEAVQAGDGGECPASIDGAGELGELRQLPRSGLALAGSGIGFDEIGRIRQEARLTHAVALGQVRDRYELLDRSLWARQTQLEQTERGSGFLILQAWAEADTDPAIREMLLRRRRETVTAVALVLQEGVMRGELPSWLDVPSVGHALAALLDGVLIEASEDGAGYRRSDAERRILAVIETLLAAASAEAPQRIEPVPPRAYESARAPRAAS